MIKTLCESLGKFNGFEKLDFCTEHSDWSFDLYDCEAIQALDAAMRENLKIFKFDWQPSRIIPHEDDDYYEEASLRLRLIDSITFQVTMNAKGRRQLDDATVPLKDWHLILANTNVTLPDEPWIERPRRNDFWYPQRLERTRRKHALLRLSTLFFFVKTKPDLFDRAGRRGIVRKRSKEEDE